MKRTVPKNGAIAGENGESIERGHGADFVVRLLEVAVLRVNARGLSGPAQRELERRADAAIGDLVDGLRERVVGELLEDFGRLEGGGVGGEGSRTGQGERNKAGEEAGRRRAGRARRGREARQAAGRMVAAGRARKAPARTADPEPSARDGAAEAVANGTEAGRAAVDTESCGSAATEAAAASLATGAVEVAPEATSAAAGPAEAAEPLSRGTEGKERPGAGEAGAAGTEKGTTGKPEAGARAGAMAPARPAVGFYKVRGEIFVVGRSAVWCVQSQKLGDRKKPEQRKALPASARPSGPPPFAYVPRFCWE